MNFEALVVRRDIVQRYTEIYRLPLHVHQEYDNFSISVT